jgi:hypothetical protein
MHEYSGSNKRGSLVIIAAGDDRMIPAGKNREWGHRGQRQAAKRRNRVRDEIAFQSRRRNR